MRKCFPTNSFKSEKVIKICLITDETGKQVLWDFKEKVKTQKTQKNKAIVLFKIFLGPIWPQMTSHATLKKKFLLLRDYFEILELWAKMYELKI